MPEQKVVTPEQCASTHRGLNRIQGVVISLMGLMLAIVGWALVAGLNSTAKSEGVLHEVRSLSNIVEERDAKYNERNEALKKSLDEVKTQQREGFQRLGDKIDKIIP